MTPYLQKRTLYPALIKDPPSPELATVVVIPAYDEPDLINSLQALANCRPPNSKVEVIVVINDSEKDAHQLKCRNLDYFEQAKNWVRQQTINWLQFHLLYCPDLPAKHAGVGLARKIGMDEACRRLEQVGRPDGIILGFDADSNCNPNYFQEIENYFQQYHKAPAASIHFEHPLAGPAFSKEIYQAICLYELHLRYFINAQDWAGLPYAFQTIGSSMAVRCRAYQEQGGMNRRKAGEDFYFLHKFIPLGHFGQINNTSVIPSPRPSERVPFGTGRAVGQLLANDLVTETYAPDSFLLLRDFVQQVPQLYDPVYELQISAPLVAFFTSVSLTEKLEEMRQHTKSKAAFYKRFFRWFDAFLLMKYVHFMRDHYFPNVSILEAVNWLTKIAGHDLRKDASAKDFLLLWRSIDRSK